MAKKHAGIPLSEMIARANKFGEAGKPALDYDPDEPKTYEREAFVPNHREAEDDHLGDDPVDE